MWIIASSVSAQANCHTKLRTIAMNVREDAETTNVKPAVSPGTAPGIDTPDVWVSDEIGFAFTHGKFQIKVVSDGYISVPGEVFTPDVTPDTRREVLRHLNTYGANVHASTNIPLLRSKRDVIMFDIGGGSSYQPSDGVLQENLAAAGIDEKSITKIVFTHAHPDHIAATLSDAGALRYPNATYFVGAAEWDFWMDPDFFRKAPAALHGFGRDAQRDLGAIKDRMVLLRPGDDVVTGISAISTPGHTPGHLSFEVAGGDGLIIMADVATSEVVAFQHPEWKFGYDVDPELAIASRKRLLDRVTGDRCKLLGFHWRYPGVGYSEPLGAAYRFIPA
jgi:glyoxylase-like metal-dependent hydrolase (beta-lactamase superfamily II)